MTDSLWAAALIVVWLVLQLWLLPKLGVQT